VATRPARPGRTDASPLLTLRNRSISASATCCCALTVSSRPSRGRHRLGRVHGLARVVGSTSDDLGEPFRGGTLAELRDLPAAAVSATRPGPAVGVEGLLPDTGWPGVAVVLPDQGHIPRYGHHHAGVEVHAEVSLAARRCGRGVGEGTGRGWWRRPPRGAAASWRRPRCCSKRPNRRPPGAPWPPCHGRHPGRGGPVRGRPRHQRPRGHSGEGIGHSPPVGIYHCRASEIEERSERLSGGHGRPARRYELRC
jgi:hypothetical protein